MKMLFKSAVAACAVLAAFSPIGQVSAATAAETFKAHEAEIATNRCVAVGGYVFGIGRAISKNGGDSVGFGKARLLAFGKIADMARERAVWPNDCPQDHRNAAWRMLMAAGSFALSLEGCETVLEKRDGPERFMAVIALKEETFAKAIPRPETLSKYLALARIRDKNPESGAEEPVQEYEPRGYWEENGVKANETLSEAQFL